jgi:hypothetical protein
VTNRPSRQQVRRYARQLRRDGVAPLAFIDTGGRPPETAAVAIGRAMWRYRSELAPLAVAALTAAVASMLHRSHPGAWLGAAVVTVAASAALAVPCPAPWRRVWRVLGNPAERAYAAAVTLMTGGWLAAATAFGPARPPLPALGIALTVIGAAPWWASRRRRARVRVERKLEAWPEIAQAVGLAGSQVMSAVVDLWGWRSRIRLARGQTIGDVIAKLPAIESGLGTFRGAVRVYPTADDLANRCELRVLEIDPHADAITWPGPSTSSITEPVDMGPFEDATPATVLLLRRHALVGGVSGSGKSGGLNVVMGNLSACADVVIWAIDLKRGMELGPWLPCIGRLATTPAQARVLLADAVAILEARAAFLAGTGQRVWGPSPDMPALVIVVDEYAELADNAPGATGDADSIARRGRAVAVTLIAATQRPTQKAMGHGALRSQMDVRVCFRVRERKDVDLILGQGMLAAGWHAHALNAPGKFLISAPEHDTPRRARAYLLTDQAVHDTAARHAGTRPVLDEVSQQALDERAQATPDTPAQPDSPGHAGSAGKASGDVPDSPGTLLWLALCMAPPGGAGIAELMNASGMSRPTVYRHLADHARAGRAVQVSRGRWRACTTGEPHRQ